MKEQREQESGHHQVTRANMVNNRVAKHTRSDTEEREGEHDAARNLQAAFDEVDMENERTWRRKAWS